MKHGRERGFKLSWTGQKANPLCLEMETTRSESLVSLRGTVHEQGLLECSGFLWIHLIFIYPVSCGVCLTPSGTIKTLPSSKKSSSLFKPKLIARSQLSVVAGKIINLSLSHTGTVTLHTSLLGPSVHGGCSYILGNSLTHLQQGVI